MISIVIADDHPIVREGLKRIITECNDMRLIGEAANAGEAFSQCKNNKVDVLLLDISMPGPGFLETLQRLITRHPSMKILVLSIHPENHYAIRAIKAGASGYLTKNHTPGELATAIRQVYEGKKYLTSELTEALVNNLQNDHEADPHSILSDREYQILCLLGLGKKIKEIAENLSLSPKTVSTYRIRILEKLGLKNTGELIRYAIEKKISTTEQ